MAKGKMFDAQCSKARSSSIKDPASSIRPSRPAIMEERGLRMAKSPPGNRNRQSINHQQSTLNHLCYGEQAVRAPLQPGTVFRIRFKCQRTSRTINIRLSALVSLEGGLPPHEKESSKPFRQVKHNLSAMLLHSSFLKAR